MNYSKQIRWHLSPQSLAKKLKLKIIIVSFLMLSGLIYLCRTAILTELGNYLVLDTSQQMPVADYGIILAGEYPERAIEAATLVREGKINRLIVSQNAALRGIGLLKQWKIESRDETSNNMQLLLNLGVPRERVMVSPVAASSTTDEARLMTGWLGGEKIKQRLLIITSAPHSRRAFFVFKSIAGDKVDLAVKPSRFDSFDPHTWWHDRYQLKLVVNEYLKMVTRPLLR